MTDDEPTPPKGAGQCPAFLDEIGRETWFRVTARLDEMGLLTLADGEAVAMYSEIYSRYMAARQELAREGLTVTTSTVIETSKRTTSRIVTKVHPMLAVASDCQRQLTRLLIQLGMTPASRSSLHVQVKPSDDPILAFIAAQGRPKAGRKGKG